MKTALALILSVLAFPILAQNTAFTYQGRLNDGGAPATGSYDFLFTLYDSTNAASLAIAGPATNAAKAISNGNFTVALDFGAIFDGNPRFLEIAVRTNGGSNFFTLSPRQPISPAPFALYANNASNAATASTAAVASVASSVAATNLTGALSAAQLPASVVTNGASVNLSGSFTGNIQTPADTSASRIVNRMRAGQHAKILFIGDSMSEAGYNLRSASLMLGAKLRDWYGDGGEGMTAFDVAFDPPAISRSPKPCGFFVGAILYTNEQARMIQYSPSGPEDYYLLGSGFWFPTNQYNTVGFWYLSWPQGGTFNFGVTNYSNGTWGSTVLPTVTLNSYSASTNVLYTNFAAPPSGNLFAYWTGATATNYILGSEFANTNNGLEIYFWSQGGISLTNLYSFGTNMLAEIFAAISPDLVIFNNKNNGGAPDGHNIPIDYSNIVACLPAGTPVCFTVTPTSITGSALAQSVDTNVIAFATQHGYGLADLKRAFPSWQWMADQGYYLPDGIHPTPAGAYQEALVYCQYLNLEPTPTFGLLPYSISSLSDYGIPGQFSLSNGVLFFCVKTNTWKQVMLSP